MVSERLLTALYKETNGAMPHGDVESISIYPCGNNKPTQIRITFHLLDKNGKKIGFSSKGGSVYDVAHDCKEYFLDKGFCISSFIDFCGHGFSRITGIVSVKKEFRDKTESEAIFQAGDYLLDFQ